MKESHYEQILAEDRRLVILRFLNDAVGKTANESVLERCVCAIGHIASRDDIRADLEFLNKVGCVDLEWFADKVMIAKLKRRGQECAQGRTSISGIKSPSLED